MSLEKRINDFVQLGLFLKQFNDSSKNEELNQLNEQFYNDFEDLIIRQKSYNGWFTKENVQYAIHEIADALTADNLNNWLSKYTIKNHSKKSIGVIMAGNIPLVGFHDLLCILITGHQLQAKLSSGDHTLMKKIGEILIAIDPDLSENIRFVDKLEEFDAVIATGSDNTARYFYSYFGKYPHIIRKNRNSVAIIHENDGKNELKALGKDIFQYFGLGCRSVSKLYLPESYQIDNFFEAILEDYKDITDNNKYANNYDYNKAVYLLGNNQLLDNGFLLLKEESSLGSPVGVLHYESYSSIDQLKKKLEAQKDNLQCIVSSKHTPMETLEFGQSQSPNLSDYADGVDTIKFLYELT